jgi:hypothetical protein
MPFTSKILKFTSGRALTQTILQELRDQDQAEQNIRYSALSDGVISGCLLYEENTRIGVQNGLVKFGGRVYMLPNKESIPYQPTDAWTILKIVFQPEESNPDLSSHSGNLVLSQGTDVQTNELELGRFKLKAGSRLRTEYVDFSDMATEYDTVNLIHIRFASADGDTLNPRITTRFAREAYPYLWNVGNRRGRGEEAREEQAMDLAFCSACLADGRAIRREYIRMYVLNRWHMEDREMSNEELHKGLSGILAAIKTGKPLGGAPVPERKTMRLL